jgi:peptidoglycan-N-acetylglucosamine deacetylase
MANSAVSAAAGGKIAPFFRFPYLAQPPRILSYFAERNIAIFSGDIDSRDYTMHKPEPVVDSVMSQLEKRGARVLCSCTIYTPTPPTLCRNCSGS